MWRINPHQNGNYKKMRELAFLLIKEAALKEYRK
jgi:hypothetical protein